MMTFREKSSEKIEDLRELLDRVERHIIKEDAKASADEAAQNVSDAADNFCHAVKQYFEYGKKKVLPRS